MSKARIESKDTMRTDVGIVVLLKSGKRVLCDKTARSEWIRLYDKPFLAIYEKDILSAHINFDDIVYILYDGSISL